eukprot:294826-Pyramimonas_sp.AAC.1
MARNVQGFSTVGASAPKPLRSPASRCRGANSFLLVGASPSSLSSSPRFRRGFLRVPSKRRFGDNTSIRISHGTLWTGAALRRGARSRRL